MDSTSQLVITENSTKKVDNIFPTPYELISDETLETFRTVIYIGVIPVFSVLGLVLSVFSFILLCPAKRRSNSNIYLISLTICDVWHLLYALLYCTVKVLTFYGIESAIEIKVWMTPLVSMYINPVFGAVSNCTTIVISIERFFAVLFPLKIRFWCNRKIGVISVVFSYVIPATISFPFALAYEIQERKINESGKVIPIVISTEFGQDKDTINTLLVVSEVLLRFVPVLLVLIATTGTIVVLIYNRKTRFSMFQTSTPNQIYVQEFRITKTLLILIVVFLISVLPNTLLRFLNFIKPNSDAYTVLTQGNLNSLLYTVWYLLFILKACVNFPIYVISSREYREQFKARVCRRSCVKPESYEVHQVTISTVLSS